MQGNHRTNGIQQFESGYLFSKNAVLILFTISVSGVLTGLSGWILNPPFFWNMPVSYFIIMTLTGAVLFLLAYGAKIYTGNLRLAMKKYRTSR